MFVEVIRIIILKGDCRATVDQQKYEEQLMLFGLVFIKFTWYDIWWNVRAKTLEQENDLSTWLCKLAVSQ